MKTGKPSQFNLNTDYKIITLDSNKNFYLKLKRSTLKRLINFQLLYEITNEPLFPIKHKNFFTFLSENPFHFYSISTLSSSSFSFFLGKLKHIPYAYKTQFINLYVKKRERILDTLLKRQYLSQWSWQKREGELVFCHIKKNRTIV